VRLLDPVSPRRDVMRFRHQLPLDAFLDRRKSRQKPSLPCPEKNGRSVSRQRRRAAFGLALMPCPRESGQRRVCGLR
jgi:hypothetical protein